MTKEEKKDLTGLEAACTVEGVEPKEAEYNLVESLLKAAEFKNSDDAVLKFIIERDGVYYFTVRFRPLSDEEVRRCRKNATDMMNNPQGKKYPKIEKDFNSAKFHSLLIYTATVEADKDKIWGNPAVLEKYDIMQSNVWETVDILLLVGEKMAAVDAIMDLSGMNPDTPDEEEYAKN